MAALMHERQARLLADARAAEPRARLAQASSRADFLLRLSQTVSAVQHPTRSMESTVALLVEELVSFAQITVVSGLRLATSAATHEGPVRTLTGQRREVRLPDVEAVLRRGTTEQIPLAAGAGRSEDLAGLVPDAGLVAELDRLGSESALLLPLTARGRTYGVLALARRRGYGFDPTVMPFLEDLAQRLAVALDAALVVAESRHVAQVLRGSLLPAALPAVPHLEMATFHRVAHEHEDTGGDFYDVHGPGDDLTVVLGDVAGRGVEASVLAKRLRNAVRTLSLVDRDPGYVLGMVNRVMLAEAAPDAETLATAVCGRLRLEDGTVTAELVGAGHPDAIVLRADGALEPVPSAGIALGIVPDVDYPATTVRLAVGDTLLVYTDGVIEASGRDDLFGDERLHDTLAGLAGAPAQAVVDRIAMAVDEHLGERDHDDIAVLAVRVRGSA